jgi:hypothetical protein
MSDRSYRLLFGLVLLLALYFRIDYVIYGLIAFTLLEGLADLRIPVVVTRLRTSLGGKVPFEENLVVAEGRCKYSFEAERVLRLTIAFFLCLTYVVYPDYLWFFPWFMGFALFGAGVSGVCPSLSLFKWMGFR